MLPLPFMYHPFSPDRVPIADGCKPLARSPPFASTVQASSLEGQAASSPSGLGRTSNVLSFPEIGSFFLSSISCASLSYSGRRGVFLVTLELGVIDGGGGRGLPLLGLGCSSFICRHLQPL